jgi:hypothetical protein
LEFERGGGIIIKTPPFSIGAVFKKSPAGYFGNGFYFNDRYFAGN